MLERGEVANTTKKEPRDSPLTARLDVKVKGWCLDIFKVHTTRVLHLFPFRRIFFQGPSRTLSFSERDGESGIERGHKGLIPVIGKGWNAGVGSKQALGGL